MENNTTVFFGFLTLVNILFTTWLAFRRTKSQNILDDSSASINYRKMVLELQAEVKELRELIDCAHLYIELGIQVDNAPVIKKWEWKPIENKKPPE
jgi:hypothetical protein